MKLIRKDLIEDTFAEAFDGVYARLVVTADDSEILRRAAEDATATPSTVIGRVEGGIEKWLTEKATPDERKGAIIQFWGLIDKKKPFSDTLKKFEIELSYRIRQDILVKPFTAIYDALPQAEGKIDMMERVGHCGDGYEWIENRHGREVIVVPILVPDFVIEHFLGYARGVMGANFWIMCRTKQALKVAGERALNAIHKCDGVITSFDVCSAGSKPETNFPWIGPTTNQLYCPSLKSKLSKGSKVPEEVNFIPEVVINGVSLHAVKEAMKTGIEAAAKIKDVVRISAGNYNGKLGEHKIRLKELFR
jgi:formylmethanofuran--tetrahydromethanopterin N-formyltransferase